MTTKAGAAAPMTTMALTTYILVSLALGFVAGYVDVHNTEVQAAVLVILVSAFLVTAAAGAKPWLFGMLVGGGIFLTYAAQPLIGFTPAYPGPSHLYQTLIALIPGLIGAYAGYGARMLVNLALEAL